ncbi:Scr1 family TA system antitoxin-like transcriptional regulator [Saccharothrix variisporea]|uniref:Helix-turn-helix protein n=1 Tax=Saccharothrix variisporea TaxID=543527 RepID=A0A495XB20_9PSEU|nr:Scr1 family TA system antitoxin-like transcriptional regulator [Saccharothrix variisporea]RKT68718.1 helix-turn-helix protein [Saccharothrix variisporea]
MSFTRTVVKGYAKGQTIRALAAATGRSYGAVRSTLVAEGVRLRGRGNRRAGKRVLPVRDARVRRQELSLELLRARLASGLTGAAAGRRAGISQSKVSKVETGRLVPKLVDVQRLADVYRVPPEVRRRLLALAEEVVGEAAHRRAVVHRRVSGRQVVVARTEAAADTVRVLGLTSLPPQLLRTPSRDRRLFVVLSESALRSDPDNWPWLREVSRSPFVELGVIPWLTRVDVPDAGFRVYDESMVVFGLLAGDVVITDPDDVRHHVETFDRLRRSALTGARLRIHLDHLQGEHDR